MALVSPGVQVSVVDESFYTPSGAGTVPMLFVVSAANKLNGSGTGTAPGTLASNAGVPYLITSQRDLVDTFGDPIFQVDSSNNPIHGSELNEYGLQAAYSYLGIANAAFVVRADIDTNTLVASSDAPTDTPVDGSYWLDTANTLWGVQEWNGDSVLAQGQSFTNRAPIVITDETETENTGSLQTNGYSGFIPKSSVGQVGGYAIIATTTLNRLYYRNSQGTWVLVGSNAWKKSWPTIKGGKANPTFAQSGSITINGTTVSISNTDTVSDVSNTINSLLMDGITSAVVNSRLEIYSDGTSSGAGDSTLSGEIVISGDSARLLELEITAGTYYPPAVQISKHTNIPEWKIKDVYTRPSGSIWIKTTTPNLGAKYSIKKWNDATKLWQTVIADMYTSANQALFEMDRTGGGANLIINDIFILANVAGDENPLATFKIFKRNGIAPTSVSSAPITGLGSGSKSFSIQATDNNQLDFGTVSVITASYDNAVSDSAVLAGAINDAGIENVTAKVTSQNRVTIEHSLGGEIRFVDTDEVLTDAGFTPYVSASSGTVNLYYAPGTTAATDPLQLQASLWQVLSYTASDNEISQGTADGTLWYNSVVDEVDMLVHNGSAFVGFQYNGVSGESTTASPFYDPDVALQTDPNGPIVSATRPLLQSDGTSLQTGDIWIDTSDIENYPIIYKYDNERTDLTAANRWFIVDTTDQTTENGIIFADVRYNTQGGNSDEAGAISDLIFTDYVDPDSPDPALYPKGMLCWNLRRSGFNVKKFVKNYFNTADRNGRYNDQSMDTYAVDRWVTESGNQENGAGTFGRKAQRKVIVQALQALLNSNQEIRDDQTRLFNLMACPGYSELIGEMVTLNYDRGLTAFVLGDTPFRLAPNGTDLNNWASNVRNAVEDNDDGLVVTDPYVGVFYPQGFTSDNFGNNVVVPASHMMLRTIALNDQVAYPWFAPAGTRRGGITNASSTGYITSEGEFTAVSLNEGLRDVLYSNHVNPITFITGVGLVNYGQKTRQLVASSLDRINVARLVIYLRQQLNILAKPYLFEQNDKLTRDQIKGAVDSLLLELVSLRGIYDFLVVCDESNNTPSRIDRNELYVDVAIEPVKAVEFIYIPLRLKNTGEISGL